MRTRDVFSSFINTPYNGGFLTGGMARTPWSFATAAQLLLDEHKKSDARRLASDSDWLSRLSEQHYGTAKVLSWCTVG
ncbi:hypothetical protein [Stenotrophomonas sp. 57]|uniref:hypothetical protein n=1 Tax=Stenotrophomonas sp. 57 TaxID=3051119 RepID=UPI00256ECB41|nr:hypothetical protein [Stenotrophomonas sp. 57]